jgi:hypothetical protein
MVRPLLLLFAALMTAAVLARCAAPVAACSGGFSSIEEARTAIISGFDMVVIGSLVGPADGGVEIDVLTLFKGPNMEQVIVSQPADLIGTHA